MAQLPLSNPSIVPEDSSRWSRWAVVVLAVLVLLTFGRLCEYDFTSWDDQTQIATNPRYVNASLTTLKELWTTPYFTIYIPLTATVWWLVSLVARTDTPDANGILLNPYLFHTANVLVHLAASVMAFHVLRRFLGRSWSALAAAVLFALHPVQVESVAWVSGLKDVLAGFFSLATIAAYYDAVAAEQAQDMDRRRRCYLAAMALMLAALLSKPSAMTLAAILPAIDWLHFRRPLGRVIMRAIPFLLLAGAAAVVARAIQPPVTYFEQPAVWQRPLLVGDTLAFYLGKLLWPANLAFDYGHNPGTALNSSWIYFAWLLPTAMILAAAAVYHRWRLPLLGVAIFILAPFHVLGWVGFDYQNYSTTADHYLYVAMLGVGLVVGWMVSHLPRRVALGGTLLLAIALGTRSFVQAATWQNSQTLWANTLRVNPHSWGTYNSLAFRAVEEGDYPAALRLARKAIDLEPRFFLPWVTLGAANAQLGRFDDALAAYQQAYRLEPHDANLLCNFGGLLAQLHHLEQAEPLLREAVKRDPESARAWLNLGMLYYERQNWPAAEKALRAGIALAPDSAPARLTLAEVLLATARPGPAAEQLRIAYRLKPDLPGLAANMRRAGMVPPAP